VESARSRARDALAVLRAGLENSTLRKVGVAYALFGIAEFGVWIALLVYAYGHGGPTAGMVMVIVQLLPTVALGPLFGTLADRHRPSRVLLLGYLLQSISLMTVALAIGLSAPWPVVFLLAPLTSLSLTMTRPPQAALLPAVVVTPEELTAANVLTGWTDAAAALIGPGVVGLLIAWQSLATAVGATAVMTFVSVLLVAGLPPGPAVVTSAEDGEGVRRLLRETDAHLRATLRDRDIRVLLVLRTFYFVLIGSLDFLCVVLALSYLHMGRGGPGFLNAALGAGGLLAGVVTAALIGRRRLDRTLTVALGVTVGAMAVIATTRNVAAAIVLLAVVGLAGAVFEVTGRTLAQRSAPSDAVARMFSVLEALMDLGLVLGAVLVRAGIAIGGIRAALVTPAVIAALLMATLWRRLGTMERTATVPHVQIQLLRSISIFSALPAPELEMVARELEPIAVDRGSVVIKEGDPGDRYYAVASGELVISRDGRRVAAVTRGDGFGEIALIRDIPRQATVTAETQALLYGLQKEQFLETVTGHPSAVAATSAVVAHHLGET
jgi:CRP-like cAMP-binding protein